MHVLKFCTELYVKISIHGKTKTDISNGFVVIAIACQHKLQLFLCFFELEHFKNSHKVVYVLVNAVFVIPVNDVTTG